MSHTVDAASECQVSQRSVSVDRLTIRFDYVDIVNGLENVSVLCVHCDWALNDSDAYLLCDVGGIIVFLFKFFVTRKW